MKLFTEFLKDDAGATAIEYGLIAAATGLVLVGAMPLIGESINTVFGTITEGLNASVAAAGG